MRRVSAYIWALLLCLGSFAGAQEPPKADDRYVLGPEDVIVVTTRDVAEASGEFLVRNDGFITFPTIGEIKLAGLTVRQARDLIYQKLTEKEYKKSIEVTVNVKTMRANRIYVMGSVNSAGMLDYKPGWRLTELISAAGGLNGIPEKLNALVWRRGEPAKRVALRDIFVEAKDEANLEVRPGDVVNIQGKPMIRVTVTGKASRQGLIDVFEGDGASEAIAGMGGPLPDAALSRAKIIRKGQEIPVDLYLVMFRGQSDKNVTLEDGDIINIPENKAKVGVLGMVGKPGPVEIPDGRQLRLTDAVREAGGPVREAKTDSVMLSRRKEDGSFASKAYNIKDISAGKKGTEDPVLQDGDIVFVAQSGKPNSGTISSILGIILTGGGLFGRLGL